MATAPASRSSVPAQLATFAVVGAASTVLHLGGFVLLRQVVESAQLANGTALVVAAVANTWANRRWTFGVRGREGAALHQLQGLLVLALTLAMTSGGLALLGVLAPHAATWVETAVVAVTTAAATAVKFLVMRLWVWLPHQRRLEAGAQSSRTTNPPTESSKKTTPVHS